MNGIYISWSRLLNSPTWTHTHTHTSLNTNTWCCTVDLTELTQLALNQRWFEQENTTSNLCSPALNLLIISLYRLLLSCSFRSWLCTCCEWVSLSCYGSRSYELLEYRAYIESNNVWKWSDSLHSNWVVQVFDYDHQVLSALTKWLICGVIPDMLILMEVYRSLAIFWSICSTFWSF